MKRTALATISLLFMLAFSSCKEGEIISKDFIADNSYTGLLVDGNFDVRIDTLATQITVTCGEKVMPKVKIKTERGSLKIIQTRSTIRRHVKVVLPYNVNLTGLTLKGTAYLTSQHSLKGQQVDLILDGASEFVGDLNADKIVATLSGASKIGGLVDSYDFTLCMNEASSAKLEGFAEQLYLDFDGASELVEMIIGDRYSLECDYCEAKLTGASYAYIHCYDRINSDADQSSELHYTGFATVRGKALHEVL